MPQCVKVASLQTTHTTHQVTKGEINTESFTATRRMGGGGGVMVGEEGSGNIDNTSPLICKYQANKRTKNWAKRP